jgi:hypothetical protein
MDRRRAWCRCEARKVREEKSKFQMNHCRSHPLTVLEERW